MNERGSTVHHKHFNEKKKNTLNSKKPLCADDAELNRALLMLFAVNIVKFSETCKRVCTTIQEIE